MKQFDLLRNPDIVSARMRPYLVVLQSDFLSIVDTVVVAPLALPSRVKPIARLTPMVVVGSSEYVIVTSELAAVPKSALKRVVGSAAAKRDEILAALDLIFVGF
jgi:toxin CcdB